MNKMFLAGAVLLILVGCDKPTTPISQVAATPIPVDIPQQDGQYLRFNQLPGGETRLEAARVIGKVSKVISGYPGFNVETNAFPDVSPLVVRIKDCGVITFKEIHDNPKAMTAARTETEGFNSQCPIQRVDGLWTKLSVDG